jgi:hypothetical protein
MLIRHTYMAIVGTDPNYHITITITILIFFGEQ